MHAFQSPLQSLGDLDTEGAAAAIAAAADVALVLDRDGVIRDVALGSADLDADAWSGWVGRPLSQTVTVESREKVDELLAVPAGAAPRWRHVNHVTSTGADLPVLYTAVPVGSGGGVIAMGRDLRAMAELQQRLVEAQQSVERDYARMLNMETRYRLLFRMCGEAVLIVDAGSRRVREANPAAARLLGEELAGKTFPDAVATLDDDAVRDLLARVRAVGRTDEVRVTARHGGPDLLVCASLFRHEDGTSLLVRVSDASTAGAPAPETRSPVLDVMRNAPDGFVITDPQGRVLSANGAFLELAQLAGEGQARDRSLDRWLGRPGVDLAVLTANLREHGAVRMFATVLRGEQGTTTDVEISAVSVPDGDVPCLGFVIRNVARRAAPPPAAAGALPRSAEQLTELVGRVPLKDLVRETTDLIERLCIEAALDLTGDNRASAAEMLGLSRQSLYVKLRRYGLGDLDGDGSPNDA